MDIQTKTISVRVKDRHAKVLSKMAFDCNQVWNAANALSAEYSWIPIPEVGWVSGNVSEYDLSKELIPIRKEREMIIGAATAQSVIAQYARSRKQFKKNKLQWRCSSGPKKALGWVPFKTSGIKLVNGQIRFCGEFFGVWDSYGLKDYVLQTGSFSEDARGRWYFNASVKYQQKANTSSVSVGVDLGLKTVATLSDGVTLNRRRITDEFAKRLAVAQRSKNKKRVKAIHAKIKNSRKDALHKFSTAMVENYGAIFVGDVSSKALAKTTMAKSVMDAGWGLLKTQLKYKAIARSVVYQEVNEKYTTQTCSSCGALPETRPRGIAGLEIREWTCACGVTHDRDVNAAKNILQRGHALLAVGIPVL